VPLRTLRFPEVRACETTDDLGWGITFTFFMVISQPFFFLFHDANSLTSNGGVVEE
jgi:hypothetical protein